MKILLCSEKHCNRFNKHAFLAFENLVHFWKYILCMCNIFVELSSSVTLFTVIKKIIYILIYNYL